VLEIQCGWVGVVSVLQAASACNNSSTINTTLHILNKYLICLLGTAEKINFYFWTFNPLWDPLTGAGRSFPDAVRA